GNVLVAFKLDLADFDLRAFLDIEAHGNGSGRYLLHLHGDGGELAPVFRQQLQQGYLGFDDLGGVIGRIHGQADLDLLVAVQDVALGDGIQPVIVDGADGRLFPDVDVDGPALGRLFALNAHIVKEPHVPHGTQVALQGGLVIDITGAGVNAGKDGFLGN